MTNPTTPDQGSPLADDGVPSAELDMELLEAIEAGADVNAQDYLLDNAYLYAGTEG